jgi:choline dehydrogenase-like flavoprotein
VTITGGSFVRDGRPLQITGGTGVLFESDGPDTVRTRLRATLSDGRELEVLRTLRKGLAWDLRRGLAAEVVLTGEPAGTLEGRVRRLISDLGGASATAPAGQAPPDARLDRAVAAELKGFFNSILSRSFRPLPRVFSTDSFLTPGERALLAAVVRALLPDPMPASGPTALQTVDQIERMLRHGRGPALAQLRTVLGILGPLLPPGLPYSRLLRFGVSTASRRPSARVWATLSLMQRTVTFAYYSHPRAYRLLGYARPAPPEPAAALPVHTAIPGGVWDLVIVGTGPAGSLLASRLARPGRRVLVLEAGPYIPEHVLPLDEVFSTTRLYKDAASQFANRDGDALDVAGSFPILQGACVGGGGINNNIICFKLPRHRLDVWRSQGFPVEADALEGAFAATASELGIKPLREALTEDAKPNPAWKYLTRRFGEPGTIGPEEEPAPGFVECMVNGEDCLGCGWCGMGCAFGRKRNALQVHLPPAIERGAVLVPEARVVSLRRGDGARVAGLTVEVAGRGTVDVRARNVILCAGAIGTTGVMLGTPWLVEHAHRRGLPVGEQLSVNAGCVCHALYDRVIHEGGSFQVAFYVLPGDPDAGFVMETWWNPPGFNSTTVPGLLDQHYARMQRSRSLVTFAPLIASVTPGKVRMAQGRPRLDIPLAGPELERFKAGLRVTLDALLAGSASGERPDRVIVNSRSGVEVRSMADAEAFLSGLERVEQLNIGTGHPMGGSALSTDDGRGVVGADFRVKGVENLWICDGSLFPSASGVNPQWTIMALAHLCGAEVESALARGVI